MTTRSDEEQVITPALKNVGKSQSTCSLFGTKVLSLLPQSQKGR
jgi:hypothetical protein